jgi:hypothetical protein
VNHSISQIATHFFNSLLGDDVVEGSHGETNLRTGVVDSFDWGRAVDEVGRLWKYENIYVVGIEYCIRPMPPSDNDDRGARPQAPPTLSSDAFKDLLF